MPWRGGVRRRLDGARCAGRRRRPVASGVCGCAALASQVTDKKLVRRSLQLSNDAGVPSTCSCAGAPRRTTWPSCPTKSTKLVQGQEKYKSQALNELIVCPIRATRLIGVDSHLGGGPRRADPYVICDVDGLRMKTSHKSKTCRPEWLEVLKIPVDGYSRASLSVKCGTTTGKDVFLWANVPLI